MKGPSARRVWLDRLIRAAVPAVAVSAAVAGAGLLVVAGASYSSVKAWADALAPDGSMESVTPMLLSQLEPWCWGAGLALVLIATVIFTRRARLESWSRAVLADALDPEVDLLLSRPALTRAPVVAACVGTALVFWALYLVVGVALWSTGVFDHYDGLFHTDPPRVVRDLAQPGGDGGRSHLHPLFVLFLNPLGVPLAAVLGGRSLAATVLTATAGATSVLLGQLFFHGIGMPFRAAILWSFLLGLTASHLVFSVTPDTFIFAAPPLIACCILAARRPQFVPFAAVGVMAFGVTSTNVITTALIHLFSLRRRLAARAVRTMALLGTVLICGAVLALVQQRLFPSARLFFSPSGYESSVVRHMPALDGSKPLARATDLSRHMLLYTLIAPVPYLGQLGRPLNAGMAFPDSLPCHRVCAATSLADHRARPPGSHPLEVTFQGPRPGPVHPVGRVGMLIWLAALAGAGYGVARGAGGRSGLLLGIAAGLAFQFVLHMVYGDDLFLYSPHWAFLLIGGAALALRGHWHSRWLGAGVATLVLAELINNSIFVYSVWTVFSRQTL